MLPRLHASLVATVLLAAASPASAAVISLVSGAGDSCSYGAGSGMAGACTTQAVTPHSAWQTNNPAAAGYGGVWISYANTGVGGSVLAPQRGSALNADGKQAMFSITETFSGAGALDFWVWADDTVDLYLDGVKLISANFTDATCARGPVGCEPDEYFRVNTVLGAGDHLIEIVTYQFGSGTDTNSNPFGLLYSGQFITADVPEPAALALFGAGLMGLAIARRRRRTA